MTGKKANVVPLYKGGKKDAPSNYRPVSLTCVVCKVLEAIIKDALVEHLKSYELLNKTQHGFMKGKSCLTNLLCFLEVVTNAVDNGHPVDVIYLDFAKAFDKVPHQRLAAKVKAHGIGGSIVAWIEEWLANRKQTVVVNGYTSDESTVFSGVPQGSVLGPVLFLIFVNDIDHGVTGHLLKFADDAKLFMALRDQDSALQLQQDLSMLSRWSKDWQMLFNVGKCSVVHFGYANSGAQYELEGEAIQTVQETKDLGVIVHESLKTSRQCLEAAKKANRMLGMVRRTIKCKSPKIMLKLYKQLIRPHLEYAVQAWCPFLKKDIELLESVQRRATKMIDGFQNLPYAVRLSRLRLTTLELRRERGDVIQAFKILRSVDNVDADVFFSLDTGAHNTRGHALKLKKPHSRLEVRKHFFSCRVINAFNALPPQAVNVQNVLEFKKKIAQRYQGERAFDRH